ncbi:hypothetical protein K505DRAFT_364339 [Melanomma pulvis-pyrius CBS 109.77]|uniref:Membrane anchor Opy2 N-terminal domain-containing protein n=1 Tax=Melanomma pulvis-pyrius CBS 109.77 TaxID=1314802 RepID=A0A6A6X3Q7_9PLEO|nr:hypothetical protein K505DRAFT_364339 [Melanomma pulvis-pyrius CBS 109.77]
MSASARRELENVMRSVFKRCVQCANEYPSCVGLNCAADEVCVQTPISCNACGFVSCMKRDVDPTIGNVAVHKGPNVGAIAGGVVGGVVLIAIIVFCIWKFYLKGRRRPYEEGEWQEVDMSTQEKTDNDFVSRRSTRASTHTVASMASSVLTRASNIIQIAYIPGVTNRSGPGSPDLLVPPVPPIPAMSPSSGFSTPYSASEQHFFVPDFRDSMASGTTDGYSTYARTSIAPSLARNSVASTVYRQNAIVSPLPAQTIVRGKAAVVSVKSTGSNSPTDTPGSETPPVPQIDPKHGVAPIRIQMPRMTNSSSSSLSRANSVQGTATLGKVRALNITKKKSSDVITTKSSASSTSTSTDRTPDTIIHMRPFTEISMDSTDDEGAHARARRTGNADSDSESDDDDHSRARRSLLRTSGSVRDSDITEINDTPTSLQSPFSDSSTSDYSRPDMPKRHTSNSSGLRAAPMTPIFEESSKRTSHASKRTQSPFSDDNKSDL